MCTKCSRSMRIIAFIDDELHVKKIQLWADRWVMPELPKIFKPNVKNQFDSKARYGCQHGYSGRLIGVSVCWAALSRRSSENEVGSWNRYTIHHFPLIRTEKAMSYFYIFRQIESLAVHGDQILKPIIVGVIFFHGNISLKPKTKIMKPSQKNSVCSFNDNISVILYG